MNLYKDKKNVKSVDIEQSVLIWTVEPDQGLSKQERFT